MIGRTVRNFGAGVKFTADENSLERLGLGGSVNLDKFTDEAKFGKAGSRIIPAGTIVKRDTDNRLIPADGTEAAGTAFAMASEIVENARTLRGSDLTTGLYAGGVFYEDKMPDAQAGALAAGLKAALGPKFTFQQAQGSLIIKE